MVYTWKEKRAGDKFFSQDVADKIVKIIKPGSEIKAKDLKEMLSEISENGSKPGIHTIIETAEQMRDRGVYTEFRKGSTYIGRAASEG